MFLMKDDKGRNGILNLTDYSAVCYVLNVKR